MNKHNEYFSNAKYMNNNGKGSDRSTTMKQCYKMGEVINNGFRFWRELPPKVVQASNKTVRMAELICPECGEKVSMAISSVVHNNAKSCGCLNPVNKNKGKTDAQESNI